MNSECKGQQKDLNYVQSILGIQIGTYYFLCCWSIGAHHEHKLIQQNAHDWVQQCCTCRQDITAYPCIKDIRGVQFASRETVHSSHDAS